jgi:hypothetical protein
MRSQVRVAAVRRGGKCEAVRRSTCIASLGLRKMQVLVEASRWKCLQVEDEAMQTLKGDGTRSVSMVCETAAPHDERGPAMQRKRPTVQRRTEIRSGGTNRSKCRNTQRPYQGENKHAVQSAC